MKVLTSLARVICVFFCCLAAPVYSKLPDLTPIVTTQKVNEIMRAHASQKCLTPLLAKRILQNYLEELDPAKVYFIDSDVTAWTNPTDAELNKIISGYKTHNFSVFEEIHKKMGEAVVRRQKLEKGIDLSDLPKKVNPDDLKDLTFAKDLDELKSRLMKIRSLQVDTVSKLNDELKERSLQRIAKRQAKFEEDILNSNPKFRQSFVLSNVLKATASSLDTHTAYFTPDEAAQFVINVQQRLFGIGAQLRDDLNGFTVVKIIEGGPAFNGKQLKLKDRIVAIDAEPVIGMDIVDAVDLIRGEQNSPVRLTVMREVPEAEGEGKREERKEISVDRGEVVLKESRYESSFEPFGDGAIGYLKLFSFYQDQGSSSAQDLAGEIKKLKEEHKLRGLILDLRFNSGGMLTQAVDVTGLFTKKGIIVSIKDDTGAVQHLRNLEGKAAWDGPLIVLVNRASASASEIVAQTLQDYGRAIIVGDDHTYGKGSFQTFTLSSSKVGAVNPQGEYKVTRGRYYTVSGKSPQLHGVASDVVVPGILSQAEIGEQYAKYPLEGDRIKENFNDDLADVPFFQRDKVRMLYKFDLQPKIDTYNRYVGALATNSANRMAVDQNYQNFLKELKKKQFDEEDDPEQFGQNDLQLQETYNVMKDLVLLSQ